MGSSRWLRGLGWGLVLVGGLLILAALLQRVAPHPAPVPLAPTQPAVRSTPTPEPLIPTRTPAAGFSGPFPGVSPSPSPPTLLSSLTPPVSRFTPPASRFTSPISRFTPPVSRLTPSASLFTYRGLPRWCVGVAVGPISRYNVEPLRLGWYLDWRARMDPPRPGGVEYVQMVRLREGVLQPNAETLGAIARSNPGSLWLVGNEPDVKWQDNVEPAAYARLYHEAYTTIKAADPAAQVAIGGVSQPTPLRMRYLDAVLEAYREQFGAEMPVDVWNVHNFILQEERGSWGVDIPPGLRDDRGILYEIDDSDDLEAFRRQIWDFRRWMAARGYGGRPLIVSEYGIPMPEDYGFPPERVLAFLRATFEFFLTAADPALGDPSDGYRLVQRWCWYSLDDTVYPTGRLFDPQTGALTAVGEGWVGIVTQWIEGGER